MAEASLIVGNKKKRKYSSYQGEATPSDPNLIKRDFHADALNVKWLTDITEFHIPAGKVYLSPIVDCSMVFYRAGPSEQAQMPS